MHPLSFASLLLIVLGMSCGTVAAGDIPLVESFEKGGAAPEGWKRGGAVPGVKYVYPATPASDGKRSLKLEKTANRYFPIAGWDRVLDHSGDHKSLSVKVNVKATKTSKAVVDVQFLDADKKLLGHQWAAYIGPEDEGPPVTHDWKSYGDDVAIPAETRQIVISLQIYGPGTVAFDELEVRYTDAEAGAGAAPPAGTPVPVGKAVAIPAALEAKTAGGGVASYLLFPAGPNAAKPAAGLPLLLVLPGGDGSAEFFPFVQQIHATQLKARFVVAQMLAPPQIVWPTRASVLDGSTTEEAIAAVIEDVAQKTAIDRGQVYALAWSSSGPAVYAGLLQEGSPLKGALIAMSVFRPEMLGTSANLRGRRVYLLHSPEDQVCPYRMAKDAETRLSAVGATVKFVDYAGGHGWQESALSRIGEGMSWLSETKEASNRR